MFLVCTEAEFGYGIVYCAIFNNYKDAKNYVNKHKHLDLFVKEVQNGEEL